MEVQILLYFIISIIIIISVLFYVYLLKREMEERIDYDKLFKMQERVNENIIKDISYILQTLKEIKDKDNNIETINKGKGKGKESEAQLVLKEWLLGGEEE